MKKLLVVGLALSTMAFAKGNFNNNNGNFDGKGQNQGQGINQIQNTTLTEAQQKELATLRDAHQKVTAPLRITVQEKDLAIRKELLADKVNWTKVETITKEKATLESQIEVLMLKHRVELKEKFGIELGSQGMKGERGQGEMGGKGMNR